MISEPQLNARKGDTEVSKTRGKINQSDLPTTPFTAIATILCNLEALRIPSISSRCGIKENQDVLQLVS